MIPNWARKNIYTFPKRRRPPSRWERRILKVMRLEMAIELYFLERDPVSVHTLAGAVYQLLTDLNKHRCGKPLLMELESLRVIVIAGKEMEVLRMINKAENFFKHADRDPDAIIDFNPESNELVLWESCLKYTELAGEQTPAQAFNLWSQVNHPDLFTFEQWRKDALKSAQTFVHSVGRGRFRTTATGFVQQRRR